MARFIIKGRRPLNGELRPVGNKNAVLPMMAASLLTDEPVTLRNVPRIQDVQVMLELMQGLGVAIEQRGRSVTLQADGLRSRKPQPELCARVRSSILLAGPLAARHGRATLSPPGGDVIGRRRVDTHFAGLRALGIEVKADRHYVFTRKNLKGASLVLDEASVTATENIMMAASLAPGTTTLYNAACEPHVADLGELLIRMGARIRGLGTNYLEIDGVKALHGARHTVGPDYVEVASFIAAAAVTGGKLTVPNSGNLYPAMSVVERSIQKMGVNWNIADDGLVFESPRELRVKQDFGSAIPKVEDGGWPAFPSDLMSVAIVLATQARGTILFFEKMFESRMYFVDHLISMGATIVQCDPHRVVVTGPSRLKSTHLSSPDIRAGMSLIIAALCAEGRSVIDNVQVIDRGYERIDKRLRALGADIRREK